MAIPSIHNPGQMVKMYDNVNTITRVGDGQQIRTDEMGGSAPRYCGYQP